MDINKILLLLRESMLDVPEIKNPVTGNIYSKYLDNDSKFPCITLYFTAGNSPANIDGVINASVQCKPWTRNKSNPYSELYALYDDIYINFRQNHKSNDDLSMSTMVKTNGSSVAVHPAVLKETVDNIDIYSLPFTIQCKAIYS